MYTFAIVTLLGLALWKFVGMLFGFAGKEYPAHIRAFATLGLGVALAWVIDYNALAAWGVSLRTDWMGPVCTGLIIGGMAYAVHYVLGAVEAYGRRNRDEARALESRSPRAA